MPDSPHSGRVSGRLLLIVALFYLFTAKGHREVTDTAYSVQTAEALLTRGRLDIPADPGYTLTSADGRSFSKYGIGLPLLYLAPLSLAYGIGSISGVAPIALAGFFGSFLNIPFTLLTLVLFWRLLMQFGTAPGYARLLTLGLALGTLCWRYSVYDFSEGIQACLLTLAVYGVVGQSPGRLAAGGVGLAGLVLVKLVHIALLPLFLLYLFWPRTQAASMASRPRALAFLAPVCIVLGLIGWLNAARFGTPLETGYGGESQHFSLVRLQATLPKLLGSLEKGLFVFSPVLLLGVIGWPAFLRKLPREALLCGGIVLVNLGLTAAWHSWRGGSCWGPRFLVPTIPLWLLPAGLALRGSPSPPWRAWVVGLVLLSILFQAPGVLVKEQQIRYLRNSLPESEQADFPEVWPASWVLLHHKLTRADEVYSVAEFGLPGERSLDASGRPEFQGLFVWTELLARQFRSSLLRWLPLSGLVAVLVLCLGTLRGLQRSRGAHSAPPTFGP